MSEVANLAVSTNGTFCRRTLEVSELRSWSMDILLRRDCCSGKTEE